MPCLSVSRRLFNVDSVAGHWAVIRMWLCCPFLNPHNLLELWAFSHLSVSLKLLKNKWLRPNQKTSWQDKLNTQETIWLSVKFGCNRSVYIVLSVHHMLYKVRRVFLTWCTAPSRCCCLVSLGISPCCLCICAVMETALWQVLGGREGWAVGKWPGFYLGGGGGI